MFVVNYLTLGAGGLAPGEAENDTGTDSPLQEGWARRGTNTCTGTAVIQGRIEENLKKIINLLAF